MSISQVIDNLTPELRASAEADAAGRGISLESLVAERMNVRLTEENMNLISGGLMAIDPDVVVYDTNGWD